MQLHERNKAEWDAVAEPPSGASNSIQPLRERGDRIVLRLISIADLGPSEEPDWLLPGYLARGAITLFTGLWKAGKTTFISHLLRDLYVGSGLVEYPIGAHTLILTEEQDGMWSRRRDELGLSESILFPVRDTFARPSRPEWEQRISAIVDEVARREIGLVVFDTLPSLWPVKNENDAGESLDALTPLRDIAAAGAAVLLMHHPRKSGGNEGQATRGSGALPGFADILVELKRFNPDDNADTRRVLIAMGRYEDIPPELVIDLQSDGYRFIGGRSDIGMADRKFTILEMLPEDGDGLTRDEVLERWPSIPKPGRTKLMQELNRGASEGDWIRTGKGCKNDPYRFKNSPHSPVFDSATPLS
jgi:hypothetical protein